jgi:hypothetical protein
MPLRVRRDVERWHVRRGGPYIRHGRGIRRKPSRGEGQGNPLPKRRLKNAFTPPHCTHKDPSSSSHRSTALDMPLVQGRRCQDAWIVCCGGEHS